MKKFQMRPKYIRSAELEHKMMSLIKPIIDYDEETGIFIWNEKSTRNRGKQAGTVAISGRGYRRILFNKKQIMAHRLAWFFKFGSVPKTCIDHINGNRDDNRICNLRVVDEHENQTNRDEHRKNPRIWGTTKVRGGRWYQARVQGRYLGNYETRDQAHNIAVEYAIKNNLPYRSKL